MQRSENPSLIKGNQSQPVSFEKIKRNLIRFDLRPRKRNFQTQRDIVVYYSLLSLFGWVHVKIGRAQSAEIVRSCQLIRVINHFRSNRLHTFSTFDQRLENVILYFFPVD